MLNALLYGADVARLGIWSNSQIFQARTSCRTGVHWFQIYTLRAILCWRRSSSTWLVLWCLLQLSLSPETK